MQNAIILNDETVYNLACINVTDQLVHRKLTFNMQRGRYASKEMYAWRNNSGEFDSDI
jgi:hypothetical protein